MSTIFPGSASVGQVYNNYTFDGTAWNINGIDLTENYLEESSASATYQTTLSVGTGLTLNSSTVSVNPGAMLNTIVGGTSGNSYGLVGTSTYLDVKDTNGYNKEIELDIASVESQLETDGFLKNSSASTTYLPLSAATANQVVYKNSSNVPSGSSGLIYDGTHLKVNGNLESRQSSGDEGGEIILNKPATNTTITDGLVIDVHQNKLRIFEQGSPNKGVYIDISSMPNSVGRNLAPQQVAFTVSKNNDGGNFSGDYIFNNVHLNTGGAYSTTTGLFTAPVSGNYFFTTSLQLYGVADGANCTIYFKKNGTQYPSVDSSNGIQAIVNKVSTTYHNTASLSSIIPLTAGDTINVYTTNSRGMQSHFSGYFLGY
jgi:hypothetical protein